jgi:3-hydroxyisobutyrate dehydrogenase/2-hydroxy-3-oxopropionate reductase
MGRPMARHLLQSGHEVALWSYTAGKADQLLQYGKGTVCSSPAEVASRSDCVFLCVGDTDMSRQVILGESGLITKGRPELVVVDCSTVSPNASVEMSSKLKQHNIDFLDAPCSGSKNGAENATLTFMVGGEQEVFEKVKPYFLAMGTQLYYCGHSGMGLHAKLSQNLIIGNLISTFNESFVLSTKAGVAPEVMLEILNNSAARSGLVAAKAPQVLARDFSTHFSVKWLEKDMNLILESAASLNVPTPLTALSRQMLRAAIAKGYGEQDICSSIQVLEEFAHIEVKASAAQDKSVGLRTTPLGEAC